MLARAVRASLDLGDDGRKPRDLRLADDATAELGVDDAQVPKLLAAWEPSRAIEDREARRRAAAARRAVDLAVREDRDVALRQRVVTFLLPEDHAVHVAQLGLERVDDVLPLLDRPLELTPELDQPRELRGMHVLLDRRVERASERDLELVLADLEPGRVDVRGHVAEAHRAHATVLDVRPGFEASRRYVDDHVVLALGSLDDALVERPRDERDRPVPARGRVAGVVEEDDAEVRAVVVRLDDVAAVHVGMPARLVDQQAAYVVEPVVGVASLVEDRRPAQGIDAAGDDPERLAGSVVVDRANLHGIPVSGP